MCGTVYSSAESRYEKYERQSHSKYNRRCIDNSVTGCNKCVGYCQCKEHPGFLTAELRKQHNCLGKQCFHYVAKPKETNAPQMIVDLSSAVLSMAQHLMSQNEYVRVIRVENAEFNRYNAYYVTITKECEFERYTKQIENELDIGVNFIRLNYDFDKCVALLCAN